MCVRTVLITNFNCKTSRTNIIHQCYTNSDDRRFLFRNRTISVDASMSGSANQRLECIKSNNDPRPRPWQWLVGRQFEDPDSESIYEITQVYYDVRRRKCLGVTRPIDDDPVYSQGKANLKGMAKDIKGFKLNHTKK